MLVAGLTSGAHAATIIVNASADSRAVDGNCTLREAIIAANTDAGVDACPAGSGPNVAVVPAGTYVLTLAGLDEDAAATGDLDVTADLELTGAGAASTIIDGNATDRVLDVDPAFAGVTVRVSGVTLQNGAGISEGGAVRNHGALTMTDSVVQGSRVVATATPGASGGGIHSDVYFGGSLRIERCTVRDNTAEGAGASGGGILSVNNTSGPAEVVDSTITGNLARGDVINAGNGGGIFGFGVTIVGSTVNDNEAGTAGGVYGSGTIRNSTLSGNRGGGVACEATDQTGVARPIGPYCDVGAFESALPGATTSSTSTTTSTTSTTTTTSTLPPTCGVAPRLGCQPAYRRSKLLLKNFLDDAKDALSWSWDNSAAVPLADFGDPVGGSDDYTLCVYQRQSRLLELAVPAGGLCGTRPCWRLTRRSGFVYTDPLRDPAGIEKVLLKSGASAGSARIKVKGKGPNLGMHGLPLGLAVQVQLVRRSMTTCWEATYFNPSRNDGEVFKASFGR